MRKTNLKQSKIQSDLSFQDWFAYLSLKDRRRKHWIDEHYKNHSLKKYKNVV